MKPERLVALMFLILPIILLLAPCLDPDVRIDAEWGGASDRRLAKVRRLNESDLVQTGR